MSIKQQLLGQWILVAAEMTINGKTENSFDPKRKMVKLYTPTHFSFYSKEDNRPAFSPQVSDKERLAASKTLDTGGGSYQLNNDEYTEYVEYCSYPNYEGKSIKFTLSLEQDTLVQEGPYPLKALGFAEQDGYIKETYIRYS